MTAAAVRAARTATMLSLLSVSTTALQFLSPPQPHLTAPRTNIAEVRILPTISSLRKHIHMGDVAAVAFHPDRTGEHSSSVEVIDENGVTTRIAIFPGADSQLVQDLRAEHVPFFVVDHHVEKAPLMIIAVIRAMLLTLMVICLIVMAGLMDEFIWGCFIVGAVWLAFLQEANKAVDEVWEFACEATSRGKRRHEMAMTIAMTFFSTGVLLQPRAQPIPVLVEEDNEFPPSR